MFTYNEDIFSDMHKDAYGFRPRGHEFYDAAPERKQEIWDSVCDDVEREIERQRVAQDAAVAAFRQQVADMMAMGARDEHQAKKWIIQGLDATVNNLMYGGEWVCFELGLPYTMRKMFDQACREMRQEMENV